MRRGHGRRGRRARRRRPGPLPGGLGPLRALLALLCERADLEALSLLLPPYAGNLHRPEDEERLTAALRMLHAERRLPEAEQALLGESIGFRAGVGGV